MKRIGQWAWVRKINQALEGDIRVKNWRLPRAVVVGVTAVIFLYIGVAGVFTVATPLGVSGDTRQHLDYVWQLYNGDLPRRSEGLKYPPVVELYGGGFTLQSSSANPPFFYLLQAPFIGPILNTGDYHQAVLVGRIVNLFFGVLATIALAWAGWVFGGKRRELFAVAVPALSVLTYKFVRLNLDFAIDALLVFLCTIGIVLTYKILQNGLKKKWLIPLAVLSIIGMATKAPYIVVLLISLLGVFVAAIVHGRRTLIKNALRGAIIAGIILVITAAAIGWYYYFQNFLAYGNWISAREPDYTGGRVIKSFTDVITHPGLWGLFYTDLTRHVFLSIAVTCVALSGFFLLRGKQIVDFVKGRRSWFVLPLLGLLLVGIFATNIEHAVGIGSINFRYMLPAILVFGLFLSFGLLAFKQLRGLLVAGAAIAMALSGIVTKKAAGILGPTIDNGISPVVLVVFGILLVLGSIALTLVLWKLTASQKTHR